LVEQNHGRAAGNLGQFLIRNQDARGGIADDVADLFARDPIVDGQKNRADMAGREGEFKEGCAVLHHHRDHVIGANALRSQPAPNTPNALIEGCIGNVHVTEFDGTTLWRPPGVKGDETR
jgi:hypothetical protein